MSVYGGWPKGLKWDYKTYTPKTIKKKKWSKAIDYYAMLVNDYFPNMAKTARNARKEATAMNRLEYFSRLMKKYPYKRKPYKARKKKITLLDDDVSTVASSAASSRRSSLDGNSVIVATTPVKKRKKQKKIKYSRSRHY